MTQHNNSDHPIQMNSDENENPMTTAASKSIAYEEEAPAKPAKPQLIVDIDTYLKAPLSFHRNYFDVEGGTFPDLFSKEVATKNDCSSTVRYLASPRSGRFYGDLLTSLIHEKMKAARGPDGTIKPEDVINLMKKHAPEAVLNDFEGKFKKEGPGGRGDE